MKRDSERRCAVQVPTGATSIVGWVERCDSCDAPLDAEDRCVRCEAAQEAIITAEYFAAVEGDGFAQGPHIDHARVVLRHAHMFGRPVVRWAARTVARADATEVA